MDNTVRSILDRKGWRVWSLSPETSVYDALVKMDELDIGALVVTRGARLVGMFSERDYARKIALQGKSSRETQLLEVMESPVITVTPEETVERCMQMMTQRRFRHLPVVENDTVVGMISIGDLVNWTISAQEETIQHLNAFISGSYPA
ncbi:MAG: CBS domain-containing protein [Bryobacteraceae bacterium]